MLVLTELNGRIIYLNHKHIISMRYRKEITNIKMSDGTTCKVQEFVMDILKTIRKGDLI